MIKFVTLLMSFAVLYFYLPVTHTKMNMTESVSELFYRRGSLNLGLGLGFFLLLYCNLYGVNAEKGGEQKRRGLTF